jgi:hypothetical protein
MRALGAFVMTTVLFAAAMVIAHGLAIPDPARRILPTSELDGPSALTSEDGGDDLTLGGNSLGTPQSLDDAPVAEVTAVPTPDTETGNSLRDDTEHRAAGTGETGDDPPVRDAIGDGPAARNDGGDSATNTAQRSSEGSSGPDAATSQGRPSPTPSSTASEPQPEPRSAPEPEPSDTPSEPSDAAEAPQTSSLLLPSTDDRDDDGADDEPHDEPWNSWWGGDRHHDGDRDGYWRDDDWDHSRP